jgi:hypothetical protein
MRNTIIRNRALVGFGASRQTHGPAPRDEAEGEVVGPTGVLEIGDLPRLVEVVRSDVQDLELELQREKGQP